MTYKFMRIRKYNNCSCKCLNGHIHHSRKEADYCTQLGYMKIAKEIKDFKTQVNYDLKVNGKQICRHIVDFVVTNNDNSSEIHEVKGFSTAEWSLKHKLFEAVYPGIKYLVIK